MPGDSQGLPGHDGASKVAPALDGQCGPMSRGFEAGVGRAATVAWIKPFLDRCQVFPKCLAARLGRCLRSRL